MPPKRKADERPGLYCRTFGCTPASWRDDGYCVVCKRLGAKKGEKPPEQEPKPDVGTPKKQLIFGKSPL